MQGYITLATGSQLYFDAAVNLALSVRLNDQTRPISLLCDDASKLAPEFREYFDQLIELPAHPTYNGCGDKIRMPLFSPYEETIFIDSDCYIGKPDMDRHWQKMSAGFFGMPGGKITSGSWYGKTIEAMMAAESVPYIVQMNSGVFYFKRSEALEQLVEQAMKIAEAEFSEIQIGHRGVTEQLADEPIWGVLMARLAIEPVSYDASEGSISVSTYLAKNIKLDILEGQCQMKKSKGFYILGRFVSKGWVQHSPSVPHFVAFGPKDQYQTAANNLRSKFKLPAFHFPA